MIMKTSKRNNVLLIHGLFLLIVTSVNTIASLVGLQTGEGMFAFIKTMPLAEVGLFQAYLLMMLTGLILLMNTRSEHSWKYDIVGVLAHLIPLAALFLFQDVVKEIMGVKIFIASSLIHIPWIIIESITAFVQYKKAHEKAV
jgi:hypothetical protein